MKLLKIACYHDTVRISRELSLQILEIADGNFAVAWKCPWGEHTEAVHRWREWLYCKTHGDPLKSREAAQNLIVAYQRVTSRSEIDPLYEEVFDYLPDNPKTS